MMLVDDRMRGLVRAESEPEQIHSAAIAHGMRSRCLSGAGKGASGQTTVEEVMSVIRT